MEITNDNYLFYLPSDFINSSYKYFLSEDYILVNKQTNCYNQYNTTYCDCVRVYPEYNYIYSTTYSCSISSNSYYVSSDQFSDDVFQSSNFPSLFLVYFCIVVFCVFIIKTLFNVFRKRSRL